MKRSLLIITYLVVLHSASAQFKNIKLAELNGENHPLAGPGVAINHKNPDNIVVGIEKDRVFYTKDAGANWTETKMQSPFGVGGYPSLLSDNKGEFYFFHLNDPSGNGDRDDAWMEGIICQKSSDGGASWKGSEPFGNNPGKDQYRVWSTGALKKQDLFTTWTQFDKYGVRDTSFHSNIMFSMSESEGKKWNKAIRINQRSGDCALGDNTTMGAMTAVDAKGRIFAVWANRGVFYFDRSYDNGRTWLNNDITIGQQPGGWALDIPGLEHCNGLPVMVIDNGPSRYHGSLYLVWADQRNGQSDTDIWLMRSGNGGDNWTTPLRINKDEGGGKHQFMPWVTVDQITGHIYVVYYDRRNYNDVQTDVYMAYSADGGSSFGEVKISETSFIPGPGFSPEHMNIAAHKGVITPIWTRIDDGKTSAMLSVIKDADIQKK